MTTALVYSEKYLEHKPGFGHPERPERLGAIVDALKQAKLWTSPNARVVEPKPAKREDIELAHDPSYVDLVKISSQREQAIDADTPVSHNTFELALLAAGGTIEAGRAVLSGEAANAFALVRPPGHHASHARGGGFCYFNNIAIMIKWLQREFKIKRAFICDWDAHHGNGTQDIFYDDPSVLYMSLHQDGRTIYPGTGYVHEIGSGKGEGYNVNVPLPPGANDGNYLVAMRELFVPLVREFKPEIIAISAGMDAHQEDPLTALGASTELYGQLTQLVLDQATKVCEGRVVLVLEGGYVCEVIGEAAVGMVRALTGNRVRVPKVSGRAEVVKEVKENLSSYWRLG